MSSIILFTLITAVAGCFSGFTAGLFGVGGGLVTVPVLRTIFIALGVSPDNAMHLAIGTSLMVIVPTSIVSAKSHIRRGSVDKTVFKKWAWAIILGSITGGAVAGMLSGYTLTLAFGIFVLCLACYMGLCPPPHSEKKPLIPSGGLSFIGFFIGSISALMGIGGGSLAVPALTLHGLPIHRAIGTAAQINFIVALPAALIFLCLHHSAQDMPWGSVGNVNLLALAILAPTSMLFAPLGARLATRLPTTILRRVFAVFLLCVSVKLFIALI